MIDASKLPKAKQTTLGLYVTAAQAYAMWQAAPDKVKVIDVRTPEEFAFVGHPAMAWNVPIAFVTYQRKERPVRVRAEDERGVRESGSGDRPAGRNTARDLPLRRPQRHGCQPAGQPVSPTSTTSSTAWRATR